MSIFTQEELRLIKEVNSVLPSYQLIVQGDNGKVFLVPNDGLHKKKGYWRHNLQRKRDDGNIETVEHHCRKSGLFTEPKPFFKANVEPIHVKQFLKEFDL